MVIQCSYLRGAIVPVAFALLPDKMLATYSRVVAELKARLPTWAPTQLMSDFEIALMRGFQVKFNVSATMYDN